MIFLNVEQGSQEWHDLRRTKIGASDCASIMGVNPYKSVAQLLDEKALGKTQYITTAMQRGTDLEPKARDWIESLHETIYKPICVQHASNEWMIASLDGYDPINEVIVEIKCPNEKTYLQICAGDVPEYYLWQIQHQLAVTNLKKGILVAYDGSNGHVIDIFRDEDMISCLIEKERCFYEKMLYHLPVESHISVRSEKEVSQAMLLWEKAKMAREDAEKAEEECRDHLISLANDVPFSCMGYKVIKCSKVGSIDYKKIPELKGVDLEKFRKKGCEYWKIC